MKRFGFGWPESLRCDRFPKLGEEICVAENLNSPTLQSPVSKTSEYNAGLVNESLCFVRLPSIQKKAKKRVLTVNRVS